MPINRYVVLYVVKSDRRDFRLIVEKEQRVCRMQKKVEEYCFLKIER